MQELLNKPLWGLKDIQAYFDCSQATASKIMQKAKRISVSRLLPSKAKIENVFEVMNLDLKEIRKADNKMIIRVMYLGRIKDIDAANVTVEEMETYRKTDPDFKVIDFVRK